MQLPKNTKIQSYSLRVKDLNSMCGFYEHNLGLYLVNNYGKEASFSVNGNDFPLLKLDENNNAKFKSKNYPGLYHIAIKFPDRESLAKMFIHLFNRGQKFQGFSDHLVSEAVYLSDPEGNGIELYVDKPQRTWIWQMGEVEMSTLPLDLSVLTNEIKDRNEKFKGIDTHAEIGHIHLQVSDLNKARNFYHEIIGMDVTSSSYNGALFFSAAGYHHHIGANVWHSRNSSPLPDDSTGLISFKIKISDKIVIEEIITRAEKEGLISDKENSIIKDFDNNKIILSL
jgi:catechol 2,3-dioxygenase